MSKNLIYMVAINHHTSNTKNSDYSDYSIKTWKWWCDKNDVYYETTDNREDLVERIKQAGYK